MQEVQINSQDKHAARILMAMARRYQGQEEEDEDEQMELTEKVEIGTTPVLGLTRTKKPGTIACPNCDRFFSRQCDLTRHLAFCGHHHHHAGDYYYFTSMPSYTCPYCCKKYRSPMDLERHQYFDHPKK
jgi:hypothetical protein